MGQNDERDTRPAQPNPQVEQGAATVTAPLLLGEYMRQAVGSSSPSTAFPTQQGSTPAILERGRTNHVLLYNGCFNPPHRGHLAHLVHAFRYAGAGLNVVGAVVLVADDLYLKWKLAGRYGPHKLNLKQRIRLWEEALAETEVYRDGDTAGEWCWVLSETLWPLYVDRLERLFRRDRVDVEFVRLAGGDKVSVGAVEHGVWSCNTTITTDVSRPVDFYTSNVGEVSLPRPLRNHGGWKVVGDMGDRQGAQRQGNIVQSERDGSVGKSNDSETLMAEATIVSSSSTSTPAHGIIVPTASQYNRDVWTCSHQLNDRTIYFIPSSHEERVDPDLSSTKLRQIIADSDELDVEELEEKLQGVALSPGLLAQYIKGAK
ncbi:hypothetical protein F4774DRAFT_400537 [Daldinia eschscholtzii]|nr:hypothetical protein F4774DRAFT_400537 [Daldinia eschscholtzii]